MRVGIIGHGFVGRAVEYGFSHPQVTIQIIDPKYRTEVEDLHECDVTFVCVPTPWVPMVVSIQASWKM